MAVTFGKPINQWYAENFQRPSIGTGSATRRGPYITDPNLLAPPDEGVSTADMIQHKGFPGMSNVINTSTGQRRTIDEARANMPAGGYPIQLLGSVGGGGGGGRGRIGSAAGAYGSSGRPTSARGREERAARGDMAQPRTGPLSPDYGAYFGGLNEFHQNQQTSSAWDRLQESKAMDETDAIASRMAQQAREAARIGDYASAEQWSNALNDRAAQAMAANGGGVPGSTGGAPTQQGAGGSAQPPPYFRPGETRQDAQGNTWRWNEQQGRGEMIRTPFADAYPMQQQAAQAPRGTFVGERNKQGIPMEGQMFGPYGTASVTQTAQPTTFTEGQGSALGGTQFTGRSTSPDFSMPAVEDAETFFRNAADRQRQPNKFAEPSPGYGSTMDLNSYAQRLMQTKGRLKG